MQRAGMCAPPPTNQPNCVLLVGSSAALFGQLPDFFLFTPSAHVPILANVHPGNFLGCGIRHAGGMLRDQLRFPLDAPPFFAAPH